MRSILCVIATVVLLSGIARGEPAPFTLTLASGAQAPTAVEGSAPVGWVFFAWDRSTEGVFSFGPVEGGGNAFTLANTANGIASQAILHGAPPNLLTPGKPTEISFEYRATGSAVPVVTVQLRKRGDGSRPKVTIESIDAPAPETSEPDFAAFAARYLLDSSSEWKTFRVRISIDAGNDALVLTFGNSARTQADQFQFRNVAVNPAK